MTEPKASISDPPVCGTEQFAGLTARCPLDLPPPEQWLSAVAAEPHLQVIDAGPGVDLRAVGCCTAGDRSSAAGTRK